MAELRPARKSDAGVMARLFDIAGEGIPAYMWDKSAEAGETPFDVGQRRAEREKGGFSYRNAHVIEADGEAVAMLLGYRQPDPYDAGDLAGVPQFLLPLIEFEARAPGSWYVNALATLPQHQGQGHGSRLLDLANRLAIESGARALSLIAYSENTGAVGLYERLGYRETARRPIVPIPGKKTDGDWILMVKAVTDAKGEV